MLGARPGRIAADFTPPHRIGLFGFATLRTISVSEKFPYLCSRVFQVFDGSFDSPYAMAGWFNCRRDLDGLYLVCSTTRDRFTAQELIFETLTLCVRGRVLSILCASPHGTEKERILGPPERPVVWRSPFGITFTSNWICAWSFRLPLFSRETP